MGANVIHATAVIEDGVVLGTGLRIGPFVHLAAGVVVGDDCYIGTGAVLGVPPEVRSFPHLGDESGAGVVVGSGVIIREGAQIHSGWKEPTRVGDGVMIMNQSYLAHDVQVADRATLASSVLLAGHVRIGEGANLGLGTSVHQFREVGAGSMVGMGSVVTRDLPPWCKAYGSPARVHGANVVGLERAGVAAEVRERLARAYADGLDSVPLDGVPGFGG